jgi:hypothetical protein
VETARAGSTGSLDEAEHHAHASDIKDECEPGRPGTMCDIDKLPFVIVRADFLRVE